MLRHVQNASSADETADPSNEKDGRPDMIDRAPQVRLCRSSNWIKLTGPRWKMGYVLPTYFESISISASRLSIARCPAEQEHRTSH